MNLFYTMTVGQLLYVLIGPMWSDIDSIKKYKNALKSLILSLILSIIITVTLIDNYGFNGACYSYVINLSIVHCNFAFFTYKELKIKPSIYYILFKSNEKSHYKKEFEDELLIGNISFFRKLFFAKFINEKIKELLRITPTVKE